MRACLLLPVLLFVSCKGSTVPARPAPDSSAVHVDEPAAEAPQAAATGVEFMRGSPEDGFTRAGSEDAPLLRVATIEPAGADGDALAQRFVAAIPSIYACYEGEAPTDRRWLSVEIGHYGDPASVRVQLGPTEPTAALQACAEEAVAGLRVPDGSAHGLFSLEVYAASTEAPKLPAARPDERVEFRYGAGCYRWIEEPPCPPNKRCYPDRWELCACP